MVCNPFPLNDGVVLKSRRIRLLQKFHQGLNRIHLRLSLNSSKVLRVVLSAMTPTSTALPTGFRPPPHSVMRIMSGPNEEEGTNGRSNHCLFTTPIFLTQCLCLSCPRSSYPYFSPPIAPYTHPSRSFVSPLYPYPQSLILSSSPLLINLTLISLAYRNIT